MTLQKLKILTLFARHYPEYFFSKTDEKDIWRWIYKIKLKNYKNEKERVNKFLLKTIFIFSLADENSIFINEIFNDFGGILFKDNNIKEKYMPLINEHIEKSKIYEKMESGMQELELINNSNPNPKKKTNGVRLD